MLDFMLGRLNEFARIVMCGAISDYSKPAWSFSKERNVADP
jgi:NADPH-dependent curcumin reductase CurA